MGHQLAKPAAATGKWQKLTVGIPAESIARGKQIYTPDQPADALFVLVSGQVSLYLMEAERRPLTLRVLGPGQLFGQVAAAGTDQYDSFAEALTPVRFVRIARADVARQMAGDGELALALLEDLGEYRLIVSRKIEEVAFKSVPARLASVLLDMAAQPDDPHSTVMPRRSHRQLAEMINAYRETVTKVINQFAAARLLEIDRYTITLINRTRLEELAQGW